MGKDKNFFKKVAIFFFFAITCSICMICFSQDGDEKIIKMVKKGQPIVVDGDKVEYFEEDKKITAEGNVSIIHDDVKLTCDRIEVNTDRREALCEGNVVIVKKEEATITGERILYDFVEKKGKFVGGDVEAYPWFARAQDTSKVGPNEYLLNNGYVTTCDIDMPHYRLKAKKVRIFPDDKIIAEDVHFCIGDVSFFWMPYYYHPIIQSRAKVQFIPGSHKEWGNFMLSTSRFYLRGETRADCLVDYRSNKGFAEGLDLYYRMEDLEMDGLGEGMYRMYFVHQNNLFTWEPIPFREEWDDKDLERGVKVVMRRRFQLKHRIDFNPETVGMCEFNKVSDEYFLKDYFYKEYEEGGSLPPTYISITSGQEDYSLGLNINGKFHSFETVTQKLPEVTMDIMDRQLWEAPLYYTHEMSAIAFDKRYQWKSQPQEIVNRFDTYHKLSYAADIGIVNLTPYGGFRETVYSRTRWKHESDFRASLSGGVSADSRFFRVFNYNSDFLGLDINNIRHIISPGVIYSHAHPPDLDSRDLYQMDGIDSLGKSNQTALSLENKLQTKRHINGDLTSVDLARLIISTDYNFLLQKNKFEAVKKGPYRKHGRFGDFTFDLELDPYDWLFVNGEMEVNHINYAVNEGSLDVSLNPWDSFSMTLGYEYEKRNPDPRNQFTVNFDCKVNPKWHVGVYERFDVQKRIIEEQHLSIVRDLHCWEFILGYTVEGSRFINDQYTVWMAFKIKAFPDLPIGLDRTFSYRKPGCHRPGAE